MGRGPYGKTKMQVFVTGASWAPTKALPSLIARLDVVGTIQPSGILGPGHHIATDSKGNIYLAQTTAGMQKLLFKGMSPTQ